MKNSSKSNNKAGRNSSGVSLDVASALKARKSDVEETKNEEIESGKKKKRFNVAMSISDYQRFMSLKTKMIEKNIIYSLPSLFDDSLKQFESEDMFAGIDNGTKLWFPQGRKMGFSPTQSEEKIEKKISAVDLTIETHELLEKYVTKRIKEDSTISKTDIFHELLNTVFEKYEIGE